MLTIDETNNRVIVQRPDGTRHEHAMDTPEAFEAVSAAWLRCGWDVKYVYGFTWMGRPVIQLPEDMVRIQELLWRDPSRRGGGDRRGAWRLAGVLRQPVRARWDTAAWSASTSTSARTTRAAIEAHPLAARITLIEGSSTDRRHRRRGARADRARRRACW